MTGAGAGHGHCANTLELNPASAMMSGASAIKMEYLVLLVIVFLH
jgi:hypothetical protein